MNAFASVRPRGQDAAPAKAPRKTTNTSKAPMEGNVQQVWDRTGRRTVSLAPRTTGGIVIENREQGAASVAKRQRISKSGTK